MKRIVRSLVAMLLAVSLLGSVCLASASGIFAGSSSNDTCSLSSDFPYYETTFDNYSAPAVALETLSYINNTKPLWADVEQIVIAFKIKTTKTDTNAVNLINYINSHQNKVKYVKAVFSNQAEYEECIRQSLNSFDAPVIIRQYEDNDGTYGEYMAITRQYYKNGTLTYYLNDPNWKFNASWTKHSKVNPEQGWVLDSKQSYEAIMRTFGREIYVCQTPDA